MLAVTYNKQKGISLIETLIALAVFAIGIFGMSALQTQILRLTDDQHQRDVAISSAKAIMDQIQVNSSIDAITQYASDISNLSNFSLCDNPPTTICAESYDDSSKIDASNCSVTEIATYDSWSVLCDGDNSTNALLSDFGAELSCTNSPCEEGDNLTLVLKWSSSVASSDSRLTGTTTIKDSDGNDTNPSGGGVTINASDEYFLQVFRP